MGMHLNSFYNRMKSNRVNEVRIALEDELRNLAQM